MEEAVPMEEDATTAADHATTTTSTGPNGTTHSVQLLPFASLSINSHIHPVQLLPSFSFILELVSRVILKITITGPAKALWRVDLWWEWEILIARGKICTHHKGRGAWGDSKGQGHSMLLETLFLHPDPLGGGG